MVTLTDERHVLEPPTPAYVPVPQETPPPENITIEGVRDVLNELRTTGVLSKMRRLVSGQNSGSFFNPECGFIDEGEISPTGSLLGMFRDTLLESAGRVEKTLFTKALEWGFYNDGEKLKVCNALEPGATPRKILLAYWGVNENTPWNETKQRISFVDSYLHIDFPTDRELEEIRKHL